MAGVFLQDSADQTDLLCFVFDLAELPDKAEFCFIRFQGGFHPPERVMDALAADAEGLRGFREAQVPEFDLLVDPALLFRQQGSVKIV